MVGYASEADYKHLLAKEHLGRPHGSISSGRSVMKTILTPLPKMQ